MEERCDSTTPVPSGSFWADLRVAMTGGELDYTAGRMGRAIVLLAIPMVLEMSMQAVLGLVDIYFVGQLGAGAVAVVGGTHAMVTIVFAISMGLAMAATAMVSRRIGELDPEGASRSAGQALIAGAAVSLPISVVGLTLTSTLLGVVNVSDAAIEAGSGYAAVMLGGNATIVLIFVGNAIFRGAGDAMAAMKVLWIANILNMVLDPLLIFGWGPIPAMGVTGAAVATVIGRGVGIAYQLWLLFGGRQRVRLSRARLRPDWPLARRLLRVALPAMVQWAVGSMGWLFLYVIVGGYGDDAIAGYTYAVRIIIFALLPSWGVANAAATLVGQNLGAGQPDRAERSVWIAAGANAVFMGVLSVIFILAADPFILIFTDDPAVMPYARDCIRIASYSYTFFGLGMVAMQAFNGAGDTVTPTWINLFCYWLVQVPLAWGLADGAGWGPDGAFWAISVAQTALAVVAITAFRRGSWKTREV